MALYGSTKVKEETKNGLIGFRLVDKDVSLSNLEDALSSIEYKRYIDIIDGTPKEFLEKLLPMIIDEKDAELILRNDTMRTSNEIVDELQKNASEIKSNKKNSQQ